RAVEHVRLRRRFPRLLIASPNACLVAQEPGWRDSPARFELPLDLQIGERAASVIPGGQNILLGRANAGCGHTRNLAGARREIALRRSGLEICFPGSQWR